MKQLASLPQVIDPISLLSKETPHIPPVQIDKPHSPSNRHFPLGTNDFPELEGYAFNQSDLSTASSKLAVRVETKVFKVADVELEGERVGVRASPDVGPKFKVKWSYSTPLKSSSCYSPDGLGWFIPRVFIPPFDPALLEETKKKGLGKIIPEYYFSASRVFFSYSFI